MSIAYTGEVSAAGEHEELAGRSMNWWGMAFFIASEALIFANLIASYLYLEIRNGNWKPPIDYIIPIIGTVLLLGSSIPIRFAGNAITKGNQRNHECHECPCFASGQSEPRMGVGRRIGSPAKQREVHSKNRKAG